MRIHFGVSLQTDVITVDKDIVSGTPVFAGTRVPVTSLFDHLEYGNTLDDFLEGFPSVRREQAIAVLSLAGKLLASSEVGKD